MGLFKVSVNPSLEQIGPCRLHKNLVSFSLGGDFAVAHDLEIEVGSSVEFERLICTVKVGDVYGFIISEEIPGDYKVSISSFTSNQEAIFDNAKNVSKAQVPVEVIVAALQQGVHRLQMMDRPRV